MERTRDKSRLLMRNRVLMKDVPVHRSPAGTNKDIDAASGGRYSTSPIPIVFPLTRESANISVSKTTRTTPSRENACFKLLVLLACENEKSPVSGEYMKRIGSRAK